MSEPISTIQRLAAVNNAAWCLAMWQSHGLEAQRGIGMAMCRGTPPKYYPSAVTIDPNADVAAQTEWLARLAVEGPPGGAAVKDSFNRLDLTAHGYGRLIQAQWLHRPPQNETPRPALDWRLVETADDLAAWETAWSGGNPDDAGIFAPALLGNPGVGVSNIFGAYAFASQAEAAAIAQAMFPGKGLVGYEHSQALEAALACGYQPIGDLTVWATRAA